MTNGFINLYKPVDWTSHDCVARLRRLLNTKKVGHGGTLDPKATGVLPVAVGKATKLLQYLPSDKAYRAVVQFGMTTTTDDLEGEVMSRQTAAGLSRETVEAVLPQFLGAIAQKPPLYSAIQVEGKRLYHLARQGKTIDVPTRQVTIHQLRPQSWCAGKQPELTLDVNCGPGTYIRSLARDLGAAVETGATLVALTRTHSSGFDLANSITLEDLEQALSAQTFEPVSAGQAMQHLKAIWLPPDLARRWCLGQKLAIAQTMTGEGLREIEAVFEHSSSVPLRVMAADTQSFLGVGEIVVGEPTAIRACDAIAPGKVLACNRVYFEYGSAVRYN